MKILKLFLFSAIVLLSACGASETSSPTTEVLFPAEEYSMISVEDLRSKMGEPTKIYDYPINGKDMDLYEFLNGKYEFYVFEDKVVQMNLNSGAYWGYDDSTLAYPGNDRNTILAMFGIEPSKDAHTTADTNFALRIENINDKVYQIWINDIQEDTFGTVKITYDNQYF
ncbi:hypothetical protein AAGS61_01870 [Lysinibacillus sp. KU-BSD001]|uniref:hypothetical protein n=1 Tax=Lysinibacillus sp. KU-BSD001 TaxID=3141328 RepID=UPI0036E67F86